jgi:hypothetical protein
VLQSKNAFPRVCLTSVPSVKDRMQVKRTKLPAKFFQEYLETLAAAQSFQVSNVRNWNLLRCYAELHFKLNGGAKCAVCRAHVRHVIPATAERPDGTRLEYSCLCTRCFEGERAMSKVLTMGIGEAQVEYRPRDYGKVTMEAAKFPDKSRSKAAALPNPVRL